MAKKQNNNFSFGSVFSESYLILKKNFNLFLITALLFFIPINFVASLFPTVLETGEMTANAGILTVLNILFGTLAYLMFIYMVKLSLENKKFDFSKIRTLAVKKWGTGIGTYLLMLVFLIGLLILLVIPGLIFAVYWSFTLYIIVFKDLSGRKALNYSKSLVKGRWWRVLGYFLLVSLIVMIPAGIIVFILEAIVSGQFSIFLTNLVYNLAGVFTLIFGTVYFTKLDKSK